MSIRVLSRVMQESDEKLGRRLILLAIADSAHDDGIAWPPREDIARKTRMSQAHVSVLVTEMVEDGALEIRKAQRGRRRINVYRVVLPGLLEPNYDRLPFTLNEPFTRLEILTSSDGDEVRTSDPTGLELPRNPAPTPSIEPLLEPLLPTAKPSQQERDSVWDALKEQFGPPSTLRMKRRFGATVKELLSDESLTPAQVALEVPIRAVRYRTQWPGVSMTLEAFAKHWPDLREGAMNGRRLTARELVRRTA